MTRFRCLLAAMAVIVSVGLSPALAQDAIPLDVLSARAALTDAQLSTVSAYAERWGKQVIDGSEDEIIIARQKLIEPLENPNSDTIFRTAYSAAVSRTLAPAMQSQRPIVRIGAMIVIRHLLDSGSAAIVRAGLEDANPAVRYLAGRAAAETGAKLGDATQQRPLLKALTDALAKEADQLVVEQLLAGISMLDIPEARQQLLEALNTRVSVHVTRPGLPLKPVRDAVGRVFNRMVLEDTTGAQRTPEPLVRQMALVAGRYMRSSARTLDAGLAGGAAQAQHVEIVSASDRILRWIAQNRFQITEGLPRQDIDELLTNRRWVEVRLRTEEWIRVLKGEKFNFDDERLGIGAAPR